MLAPRQDQILMLNQFFETAFELKDIAAHLGITMRVIHHKDDPYFLKLSKPDQLAVIERLKIYQQVFKMALAENKQSIEEKKLLWFAIQRLKLVPSSNLMEIIGENDLVEVYVGNRQVYRTFNYYDMCSYSIDELENLPWDELFLRRDKNILQQMIAEAAVALSEKRMVVSKVPAHVVEETCSPFMNKFSYQLKYIVPLKDQEAHRQDCFLLVLEAKLLETFPLHLRDMKIQEYQDAKFKELENEGLI